MPILARETDIYPEDLLAREPESFDQPDACWWALYTRSRREKTLMRQLLAMGIPFYGPVITKRNKSPSGRLRDSFVPLFSNYVFVFGDNSQRYSALTTSCVSRHVAVVDGPELVRDLRQIRLLIESGVPLTPEARLQPGTLVRVRTGSFRGVEGVVVRRERETRLLVSVSFLQQGASLLLQDCEVETIGVAAEAAQYGTGNRLV